MVLGSPGKWCVRARSHEKDGLRYLIRMSGQALVIMSTYIYIRGLDVCARVCVSAVRVAQCSAVPCMGNGDREMNEREGATCLRTHCQLGSLQCRSRLQTQGVVIRWVVITCTYEYVISGTVRVRYPLLNHSLPAHAHEHHTLAVW